MGARGTPTRRVTAVGNLWILLRKELRVGLRSPSLYLLVGVPLAVSLLMRWVMTSERPKPAKLAIVGAQKPALAGVIRALAARGHRPLRLVSVKSEKAGRQQLFDGKISGLLVLPGRFDADLAAGKQPRAILYFDETGGRSAFGLSVLLRDLFRLQAGQREPVQITVRGIRKITPWMAMLPAWVVMVLLSAITWMPSSLSTERQAQTDKAVLVAPVARWEYVIGKSLFGVGIGAVGSVLLLAANGALQGNIPLVVAVILLGATVATLVGVLLGLVFETPQAASGVAAAIYIPFLWGAFFSDLSGIVGFLSKLMPSYHMAEGIKRALFSGGGWISEWVTLVVLAGAGVMLLAACVWALRREAERA